jgi:hypothetical protein
MRFARCRHAESRAKLPYARANRWLVICSWLAGYGWDSQKIENSLIAQKFNKFDALKSVKAPWEGTTMTTIFSRLLKAAAQGTLVAFAFLPMPASAIYIPVSTTFEVDFFGCTPVLPATTCSGSEPAGSGTITFPDLGPSSPAAPFPGVGVNLTILSYSFTEADITSIAWTISSDQSTLTSLALSLDTDPSWTSPDPGGHDYAYVYFSQDAGGTWNVGSAGCSADGICFQNAPLTQNRTATATPAVVPLPPAFILFSIGLTGLTLTGRKKKV